MRPRIAVILLAAAASLTTSAASLRGRAEPQPAAKLVVKAGPFRGKEGVALVALYDREQTWLNVPKAARVARLPIAQRELSVTFEGLAPGHYGVAVIHDANRSDDVDMRWLPWPRPSEGVGLSNNPESGPGRPRWEASRFQITGDTTLNVALRYFD